MRTYTVKAGELGKTLYRAQSSALATNRQMAYAQSHKKASKGAIKRLIKRGDISTASGTATLITDLAGTKIERLLVVSLTTDHQSADCKLSIMATVKKRRQVCAGSHGKYHFTGSRCEVGDSQVH